MKVMDWMRLTLIFGVVIGNPVFHTVNDLDLNGNKCPLQDNRKALCPPICVTSRDSCPNLLATRCGNGLTLCNDGTCKRSCKYVHNVCGCGADTNYVPCRADFTVYVPQFNPTDKTNQVTQACVNELGLGANLTAWNPTIMEPQYWGLCPERQSPGYRFDEPMWISVFSVLGAEVALLALWFIYKSFAERNVVRLMASESAARPITEKGKPNSVCSEMSSEAFQIKGYRNHLLGTLTVWTVVGISLGWVCYLGVIVADYYGEVTGFEYGIAYEDYNVSSSMFIGVWVSAVSWFFTLNVFLPRLRNTFRVEVSPLEADVVQVERPLTTTFLLDDSSKMLLVVRRIETNLRRAFGWDRRVTTCGLQRTEAARIYFSYQCMRYVYDEASSMFQPYDFELGNTCASLLQNQGGLTTEEANRRLELKGPNFIAVHVPSFPVALAQEFTSFFYLYQLSIMWLFYYLAYYQVGVVDTAVILISAFIKTVIRVKSERRIKEMAEHCSDVKVLRDGLVPGDVIQIENGTTVPCDATVLSGNIVADESSLTGEPLPIRKFPIKDEPVRYDRLGTNKINSLFAGTTVAQANAVEGDPHVKALVHQTSTSTDKGQLVHDILFPNPISFIFDEQLKVVMAILCVWGLVLFFLALWLMKKGGTSSWFYGMFCLSQVISPLLPAALVVGQSVAASRLRGKKIFCVDLPRIMIAGKVQMFCFDKTGTLTKEGLEFYGGQPSRVIDTYSERMDASLHPFQESFAELPSLLQLGVATCHAVTKVGEQMIGNPVDIEMFNATGWQIHAPEGANYVDTLKSEARTAHIVKRYEFVHARASMSVAVLDPATGHVHVFVKGSFEKLKDLATPGSIPDDYDRCTGRLAMEGCYVLAMAHRDLGRVDPSHVRSWTREQMEEAINLIGLVVFKNKLKVDTRDAILELKDGATRTIMITGDTALTGIYISRACGMMPEGQRVLLADVGGDGMPYWVDVDAEDGRRMDTSTVLSLLPKDGLGSDVELAMTGKAFRKLGELDLIRTLLLNTRVFARMLPQDKVDCVELHMERGITAMCGDGGNDCGALRAAHVGIALSEAEASIVSPFSSSFRSVRSCVELIRQGRAALATSFAGYKYLIMYGEIMACLKIISFYFSIQMSAQIWILVDAFIITFMAFAISQAKAAPRLAPSRPTSRILGPETLASTLGQVVINFAFVFGAYPLLFSQPFFKCHEFDSSTVDLAKWYLLGDNYEASTLSFVTMYQFVNAAAIYNFGYRYRQPWHRNYLLVALWWAFLAYITYMLLADPSWLSCIMRLNCADPDILIQDRYAVPNLKITPYNILSGSNVFPMPFRVKLFAYCLGNIAAGLLWERVVVLGPVRRYFMASKPLDRLKLKL
ncbi:hypothetical protein L0F63_004993 [Massospora cicadina]|nr:hypothetical protein L0F63_004993 [Massospora cicadina]